MKKFLLFTLVAIIFAACGAGSQAEEAEVGEAQDASEASGVTYAVDIENSTIDWTGRKIVGDDKHSGTLSLSEGSLALSDGNITGGSFTIDMASIAVTDEMPDEYKTKLVTHLSNGDFFEVETYPAATFEITGVEALEGDETATHTISGNLTMKDTTHNVTFNATVDISENTVKATSQDFTIDRTLWSVNYGSTILGTLKDKAIQNDLELKITLVANTGESEEATEEVETEE